MNLKQNIWLEMSSLQNPLMLLQNLHGITKFLSQIRRASPYTKLKLTD